MSAKIIVDVETTGLSPQNSRLTEIALFHLQSGRIEPLFHTLLHPEGPIPSRITQITGISNAMVKDSPRFFQVARKIVELTEGATLIGHNVRFDYSFLRAEFARFGYDYTRPVECTVSLSRRYFPGLASYSLGKICQTLGIHNSAAHRAAGDAEATARLYLKILEKASNVSGVSPA